MGVFMGSITRGSLRPLRSLTAGIIGLIALGTGMIYAQTAAVTGTVRDMSGAALPGTAIISAAGHGRL